MSYVVNMDTLEDRLQPIPVNVLTSSAALRLDTGLSVERTASFDADYMGAGLIQVWDHHAEEPATFWVLMSWVGYRVIKSWPPKYGVDAVVVEAAQRFCDWMNSGEAQADRVGSHVPPSIYVKENR